MKFFFVTYGGGHADLISRLIPYLESFKNISCGVLALTTAGVILDRYNVKYKRCSDYVELTGYHSALTTGDKLSRPIWHPSTGVEYSDSCAYMGISMHDLIEELGEEEAQSQYDKYGRKAFLPIHFMENVIKLESPDVVVTTCLVRMEKAAIIAANKSGVPSVLIDDLFGYSICGLTPVDKCKISPKVEHLPGNVFVLNDFVKNRLMQAGFPEKSIYVTGQPVFSELKRDLSRLSLEKKYMEIKHDNKFVVMYAAPGKINILNSQLEELKSLVEQKTDIHFIIKLHPSTAINHGIQERLDAFTKNTTIIHKGDVLQLLKISDIVIVHRSTVGLQTIFLGKKLIIWGNKNDTGILPYDKSMKASYAKNVTQLSIALDKILATTNNECSYESDIFFNTPNALKNIHDALNTIYESKLNQ